MSSRFNSDRFTKKVPIKTRFSCPGREVRPLHMLLKSNGRDDHHRTPKMVATGQSLSQRPAFSARSLATPLLAVPQKSEAEVAVYHKRPMPRHIHTQGVSIVILEGRTNDIPSFSSTARCRLIGKSLIERPFLPRHFASS